MAPTTTTITTDAAGDAGNSSAVVIPSGVSVVNLNDATDLTGVTIIVQHSKDGGTTWNQVNSTGSLSANTVLFNGVLTAGHLRVNITGGGAGDNIDTDVVTEDLAGTSINAQLAQLFNRVVSLGTSKF